MASGQPPSQARPTKRRKVVPGPETLETIASFPEILANVNSDDPLVRSHGIQTLSTLAPLMQELATAKKSTGTHYAASKFRSFPEACTILQVTYDLEENLWNRHDIDDVPSATLSTDIDSVIQNLKHSDYHKIDNSDASVRVVVELLILDRLNHLCDRGALERLQLYPEVDVNLLLGDTYVTGRADWLLCHDDPEYGIDSTLIAIEAKRSHEFSSSDSQIAMYLAAIQASRAKSKVHAIAFGIATDSNQFRFWFMNSERRLFSSMVFDWRIHKAKIIAWVDKMLAEAIEASPLTTPTLRRNVSLRNWEKDFRRRQLLSSASDDSPLTEGLPFDINVPESSQLVGPAWYRGQKVMVVEYESSGDDEDAGDGEDAGEN
ncbi:hypothetical protein N7527_000711 [Penicillium freii]|nr:hypothetical protein N7527_000711 [Penicillium freii]